MNRLTTILSPLLAVVLAVAGYFCLIRWAECPDYDRACFVYGPN